MHPPRTKTLADLEWSQILGGLASRTKTDLGRERCLARPFFEEAAEIREAFADIAELRTLVEGQALAIPVWGVRDIRVLVDRAQKHGMLEPQELLGCANVLAALARTKDFLDERRAALPRVARLADRIAEVDKVTRRIERSFDPTGELSDRASPALFELRERTRGLHRGIKGRLDSLLHDLEFTKLLRETYFTIRNERYVVPVVASFQGQVPGIVHNASQSGQTLFVEPETLISQGNELAIAQSMVLEEERRILQELSELLGAHAAEIAQSLEAAAELDALEAAARLSADFSAATPELVAPGAPFRLVEMRHPLLVLQGKQVVANDVAFSDGEKVLVISGPNAGGKTVTMSGIGLCALLVRAGLPVPAARGSSLPLFADVRTAIGDDQDLSRDLSTFSAHLTTLKDVCETSAPGTLVLIDEIAADTDPREGAAIALAVLEELAHRGTRVVVTTHLDELKAVALTDPAYVNARVEFDAGRMAPTYRLRYGTPGSSSAIEIARRVGLAAHICNRAEENMKTSSGPLGRALEALERERAGLAAQRQRFEEQGQNLQRQEADLERLRQQVKARERAIESEARAELVAEVEHSRAEVRRLLAELQARPTVRAAVEAQEALQKRAGEEARRLAGEEARAAIGEAERAPAGSPITVGMRVKVLSLNKEAQVLEVHGDEALVTVGPLKLRQKLGDLAPLKGQARPLGFKKDRKQRLDAAASAAAKPIDFSATRCDVRGLRAEDAVKLVETFLDRCYGDGVDGATIVHGLGSGALRATLRDYLQGSPYVRHFRSGEAHEGGEGATIVELKG